MRKRLIIDLDVNFPDEKAIVDKIAYAAMKVLRSNRGNLISIRQEVLLEDRPSRLFVPDGNEV